jgi:hypothetical protein
METTADELQAQWIRRRRRGRLTLILLILVFALPLAIATWLYHNPQVWTPTTFTNHGELMDPPRPVEPFSLVEVSGEPFGVAQLRGYWTLLHVGNATCDPTCEQALIKTRQLRLALGHDIDRVQRVYLSTEAPGRAIPGPTLDEHPRLRLVTGDRQALAPIMGLLGEDAVGDIFLLDPLGNLVLRYGPGVAATGMFRDVKRLLRNSRIG